jgi:hypothetical protein
MVTGWFLRGVGFYLRLVTAPQIHATIGLGPTVKLKVQFEILKLGSGDDVSTLCIANQGAAFDLLTAYPAWITKPPSGEIFAME